MSDEEAAQLCKEALAKAREPQAILQRLAEAPGRDDVDIGSDFCPGDIGPRSCPALALEELDDVIGYLKPMRPMTRGRARQLRP
jgi:hypothetical protein